MRPTLGLIAKDVGVHTSSVSRVLSGKPTRISAAKAAMIVAAAKRLDYRPNTAAKAMVSGRFNCLAMLMSTNYERSYLPRELIEGVEQEASRRGMRFSIASFDDEQLITHGRLPAILKEHCCDGLLVNYQFAMPRQLANLLDMYSVPSVWINVKRESDSVFPDELGGAAQVTEHLIRLGHRRIAYVSHVWPSGQAGAPHYSLTDRRDGYCAAMRQAELEPNVVLLERDSSADGRIEQLLTAPDRPTAMVTYTASLCDMVALAAALKGMRVPRDLSLATVTVATSGRPYTHSLQPFANVGSRAVDMLLQRIAKPQQKLASISIAEPFMAGTTSAPPPN
jgi:LacI family transcriptional regulator